MAPTPGRIVLYRLSSADCRRYEERCSGRTVHGNPHRTGDVVPLLVVRVWQDEYPSGNNKIGTYEGEYSPDKVVWHVPLSAVGINGQAFIDGDTTLWVTSAPQGDWPGSWDWPARVSE